MPSVGPGWRSPGLARLMNRFNPLRNARLAHVWELLRTSYWFVPTVMAVAALVLGASIVYVDAEIGSGWLDGLSWYQSNKPDGAQEVLSTIAGSAIRSCLKSCGDWGSA